MFPFYPLEIAKSQDNDGVLNGIKYFLGGNSHTTGHTVGTTVTIVGNNVTYTFPTGP